jgi:predicted DnaQ family exonuclease/DinG family helicase
MPTIVALDIETTGLDAKRDAIIEIGVVKFNERRIEDKWSTLINPKRSIPPFIHQLTGITNQMVMTAPMIEDILSELDNFVGDAPILGHNIQFDLSFLKRHRLFGFNEYLDTYEMASVLLPSASRYGLGSLVQALGIPMQVTHRALDDAHATYQLYNRLIELADELPIQLLAEIVKISDNLSWGGYWGFRYALEARAHQPVRPQRVASLQQDWFSDPKTSQTDILAPNQNLVALDPEEVASVLEHGGLFSHYFPSFEYRPQQVAMTHAVTRALSDGQHLMVEAGTGVGKSIAYLVPAAMWSVKNNSRVVISTNTINLQDQLIHKDIPDIKSVLGLDIRAAILKGRSNYLCPRRFENLRRHYPETAEEMRILAKILVWMQGSFSGDRSEINLNGPLEREVWQRLSAEDDTCTIETCLQRTGGICPFYQARQAAGRAHLVIVNHALLLADVASGSRVLPEYDYVIVDEAHHLEDATTNALSIRITPIEIERLIRELGGTNTGILGRALAYLKDTVSPADYAAYNQLIVKATDLAFQYSELMRHFFSSIRQFLVEQQEGNPLGNYAQQERILPATRRQPNWSSVEASWDDAEKPAKDLSDILSKIIQAFSEMVEVLSEESQDTYNHASGLYRKFLEIQNNLDAFVFNPQADQIYWTEIQPDGKTISLHIAPLHIGELMEKYLWHAKSSVILTSATLTAAGEFTYIKVRLRAVDANELALGSPFDYENAALIYIPQDIPEPADRNSYQRTLDQCLIHLSRATGGRALVLFTSYAQLRQTSEAITPALAKDDIFVFEQGGGSSSHTLLENFRTTEKAVLLGTRAFWEGVDVPGEALSVLVIAKLPFDVPTDPIIAARSDSFDDPFSEYNLPEAILRFRQGFGRLIRTQSDRGVVVILDHRILSKNYGKLFLRSLPECTVKVGPLSQLPSEASRWLNI